jgi:hypothetical protein
MTDWRAQARHSGGTRTVEAFPPLAAEDPTWDRLDDQHLYKWLKLLGIGSRRHAADRGCAAQPRMGNWRPSRLGPSAAASSLIGDRLVVGIAPTC